MTFPAATIQRYWFRPASAIGSDWVNALSLATCCLVHQDHREQGGGEHGHGHQHEHDHGQDIPAFCVHSSGAGTHDCGYAFHCPGKASVISLPDLHGGQELDVAFRNLGNLVRHQADPNGHDRRSLGGRQRRSQLRRCIRHKPVRVVTRVDPVVGEDDGAGDVRIAESTTIPSCVYAP